VYDWYVGLLGEKPGISFQPEPEGVFANRWLTTILIDPATAGTDRETLRLLLQEDNIESRPLWKPMHLQPFFQDAPAYVNGTCEHLFEQGLCLPSGSNLTQEEKERIASKLPL